MAKRMSQSDENKIRQYSNLYDSYKRSGNRAGMEASHNAAEQVRAKYGYSGGADGSGRNPVSSGNTRQSTVSSQKTKTPQWTKVDRDFIDNNADLQKIDRYSELYKAAQDMGNQTLANSYHNAAEAVRAQYGYSGGRFGAEYIPLNQYGNFTKTDKPEYDSRYDKSLRDQLEQILNLSYADWSKGDEYQYLSQQYSRNGQKAMQNTMAQLAARTGGIASSYAVSAGQQAYNDYIAQLESAAFDMYQDERNQKVQNLGLTMQLEDTDYNRYLNDLNQYNNDLNFDYNRYLNNRDFQYGLDRDEISDNRYEEETMYNRNLYEDEKERQKAEMAAQLLASVGDYSGYQALLGLNDEQTALLQRDYLASTAPYTSSGSSGGESAGTSDRSGDLSAADGIYDLMYQAGARSEGDAYAWLLENGYSTTQAGKLATYFADKIYDGTIGQVQNPFAGAPEKDMKDWIIGRYADSDDGLSETAKRIAQSQDSDEQKERMLYTAYENNDITEEDFRRLSKRFEKN